MNDLELKSQGVLDDVNSICITVSSFPFVNNILKQIRKLQKEIEKHHEPVIKAAHQAHKEAVTAKKRISISVEQAESVLKEKLCHFYMENPEVQNTKVEGITFVDNYSYLVEDAKLIPKEYWELDTKKIGKQVRTLKEMCNIPGIRVVKGKGIRVTI